MAVFGGMEVIRILDIHARLISMWEADRWEADRWEAH